MSLAAQKQEMLDFIKGLTNDLIQGNALRHPDKLDDKTFEAAFLNLRNYLSDTIEENHTVLKKNKRLINKNEELAKNLDALQNQLYQCNETIEKLRDDLDLKESSERILQHELKTCKESHKNNDNKHASTFKEYDNLANEMKSQIEILESRNNKLNGTINHLKEKIKNCKLENDREKKELHDAQAAYHKNMKNYEKSISKLKHDRSDLEEEKEELYQTRLCHQNNVKECEKKLAKLQNEKVLLDKEKRELQGERNNFKRSCSEFDREQSDFDIGRNDMERERSDVIRDKFELEKEREDLFENQHGYKTVLKEFERTQTEFERTQTKFEKTQTKFDQEKADFERRKEELVGQEVAYQINYRELQTKIEKLDVEKSDLRIATEKLNDEEIVYERNMGVFQGNLQKVEQLQDSLEQKMKDLEVSAEKLHLRSVNAMPVISSTPVYTLPNSQSTSPNPPICIPLVDQSSINPSPMLYNDISNYLQPSTKVTNPHTSPPMVTQTIPVMSSIPYNNISYMRPSNPRNVSFQHNGIPEVVHHHLNHQGNQGEEQKFCNIHEHKKMNNNLQSLRDALLQREVDKLEEGRSDLKWDLCRLESKVGDAVMRRSSSLYKDRP